MVKIEVIQLPLKMVGEFHGECCMAAKAAAILSLGIVRDEAQQYLLPNFRRVAFYYYYPNGAVFYQRHRGVVTQCFGPGTKWEPLRLL